jgi:hypothetical protein
VKPLSKIAALAAVLIIGFFAGWVSHGFYKPAAQHVIVDDMPFMSGSGQPKPQASDCGTAEECMKAATCEGLSFTDRKTHQVKYPKGCEDYAAKKRARSK